MRRRDFLGLIGSGTIGWTHAANSQRAKTRPLVAWLGGSTRAAGARNLNAFLQGLRERGYEDGKTVDLVYRWAEGNVTLLPILAKELVAMNPDVILAASPPGNIALMQTTASIPIVGALTIDPIKLGLAVSHNRPGRNFTGMLFTIDGLPGKQAELLLQLLPHATTIGVLLKADSPTQPFILRDIEAALHGKSIRIVQAVARKLDDLPTAFETLKGKRAEGVVLPLEGVFFAEASQVIVAATAARLPAVYDRREHVERGGLASYGVDVPQNFLRTTFFVDRILKGGKPGELPIELPTKYELVINLKAARTLGIAVPPTLLARADEVIE